MPAFRFGLVLAARRQDLGWITERPRASANAWARSRPNSSTRARMVEKSSAARGRARSRRNSSMRARIIGKSSAARGRVTFPPFSCNSDVITRPRRSARSGPGHCVRRRRPAGSPVSISFFWKGRVVADSLLEGTGFEPSVPQLRRARRNWVRSSDGIDKGFGYTAIEDGSTKVSSPDRGDKKASTLDARPHCSVQPVRSGQRPH